MVTQTTSASSIPPVYAGIATRIRDLATGEGLGASHQTGWTALAAAIIAHRRA